MGDGRLVVRADFWLCATFSSARARDYFSWIIIAVGFLWIIIAACPVLKGLHVKALFRVRSQQWICLELSPIDRAEEGGWGDGRLVRAGF